MSTLGVIAVWISGIAFGLSLATLVRGWGSGRP